MRTPNITLDDLLDLIDYNRESTTQKIEIVRRGGNWEDVDRVGTDSCLLIPFGKLKVKEIGAIEEDIIRVDIDWSGLNKEEEE